MKDERFVLQVGQRSVFGAESRFHRSTLKASLIECLHNTNTDPYYPNVSAVPVNHGQSNPRLTVVIAIVQHVLRAFMFKQERIFNHLRVPT